jgi:1,2-diacylglycerol 3-alpha-glucosyltransferase
MLGKINVCLMNDSFPPVIDGVSNAVFNYAQIIQEKYGNAVVVTPQHPRAEDNYPFQVLRYPSVRARKLAEYRVGYPFSASVFHKLRNQKNDIIHLHCPFTSAIYARVLRSLVNIPIIFTYHTKYDIDIKKVIAFKGIQKSALNLILNNIEACDEVWVVSRGAGENLRSLGYQGDYVVMRNGVDLPKGRVPKDKVEKLRDSLEIPSGNIIFLFVGRLMWYKGIGIILDGLKKISDNGMQYKMIFIGEGQDKSEIIEYAKKIGVYSDCIFAGAVRDRDKLRTYYSLADMFLFPSTFDTNGLVVSEAAACGLPSMLIKGSCAAEGVEDCRNGLLIEENADSMAEVLQQACGSRDFLRQIGQRAMDEIYVSWEDSVAKAIERYETVLHKYRGGYSYREPVKLDEFYSGMANVLDSIERARSPRSKSFRKGNRSSGLKLRRKR